MKFSALVLLPLASAWTVTTGYWSGSEVGDCQSTIIPKGWHVTVEDLLPGQKVFFFKDSECEELEISTDHPQKVKAEVRLQSFQVLDF
ncbi:hypothetical protein BDV59DRAFT_180035 [Aspergillus ambiguus]|uniref:uncharacterized protein n=1 Tax=Aspergillus ambiguus TaxID=176160 RepID=UPI003CCC9C2A